MKSTASYIGIRESRHIQGDYRLTADDLLDSKVPEDSILLAANSVDVHGRFGPTSNEYVAIKGDYYGIPYRSLVVKGFSNLLVAGRCIGTDRSMEATVRVMPACFMTGQAAGTAAAMASEFGDIRKVDAKKLRERLISDGALI
jgi:hypothetical protein